jgi:hypothetical protein
MDKTRNGNRTIFKTRRRGAQGRCLALKTVTGIVTDDPKHTKAIVERFRALGPKRAQTRHLPDDERCSH